MKKVITALSNKTVNSKLKEYKEIQVVMNDIQYQDGIIEALEINTEIEYIILSELLPGEYKIKELIEKIRKINNEIKIILILEKQNKELENYLFAKGDINIFYNNEIEIKEIAKLIINQKQKEDLEKEIQELKKFIFSKEENNLKNNKKNLENKLIKKEEITPKIIITQEEKIKIEEEFEKEYEEKIITNTVINKITNFLKKDKIIEESNFFIITGVAGVGKSIFTVNIANTMQAIKKHILIIDLDFFNNSIQTLFGKENKVDKEKNKINIEMNEEAVVKETDIKLENLIIKINSKIDLISKINILFNNQTTEIQLLKIIKEIKNKYDLIIIDTQLNENNYLKIFVEESDKIIFITEPNILQIKKSKKFLENFINEFNVEKEKIYLIFNKIKNDTICFDILKEIFKDYNIIGQVNFIKNCNILINQNMKKIFLEKEIKKQYKKISKNMLRDNNLKKYYLNKIRF